MELTITHILAGLGMLSGIGVGFVARYARFCTYGSIEDAVLTGRTQRLKTWALAIAVAVLCVQLLYYFDIARLEESFYLSTDFSLLGAIIGGLLFGFGMSLVGTCAYGTLVRLGGGDLRALIVAIFVGLTAYMTMRGILGILRVEIIEKFIIDFSGARSQGIPDILAYLFNMPEKNIVLITALVISGSVMIWCVRDKDFMRSKKDLSAGILIGLFVAFAFFATGYIGNDEFAPVRVEALAYVRPLGETIIYLSTFSGAAINFGIAAIIGTFIGSLIAAFIKNEIRIEGFDDVREMRRHLMGAVFMGFGAVTASGCTIGQGISGMATLSLNAPIALISIFLGALFGIYSLHTISLKEASQLSINRLKKLFSKS